MPRSADGHPPLRWFADRADGLLSAARAASLEAHLASGCAACAAQDASLRATLATLRKGPLAAPPSDFSRRAASLHRERRIAAFVDRLRELAVSIVADTRVAPAFAFRAAPGDERRLLYAAAPWEIDLCVVTGALSSDVMGQIAAADGTGALPASFEIHATRARRRHVATVTRDGRFEFRGLAAGRWVIAGRVDGREFELPALDLERAG